MKGKLDKIDLKILDILQNDCRITTKDLAEKLNLSTTPIFERVKKLDVAELSEIQFFEKIPLKSFFFKDHENHDFEIQEFISPKDKLIF